MNYLDVLCIGQAAYDLTFPVDEFPIENSKYEIYENIEGVGGPAANASYLLAKWGVRVGFCGIIGDDIYGQKLTEELVTAGVDLKLVKILDSFKTPLSVILVNKDNGSRTIVNRKDLVKHHLSEIDETINPEPKIILFDGHEPILTKKIIETCKNAKFIFDAGSYRDNIDELISAADYLIASEQFIRQFISKMDILSNNDNDYDIAIFKLKGMTKGKIIVTLGEQGLIYEDSGEIKKKDAIRTKPVDTTGAGDVFHGAFAYGLLKGNKFESCLDLSQVAASLSVEKYGSSKSIPSILQVRNKLQEMNLDVMM
jgi:sugar/nucleoside kinase (ribokinase family)